MSTKRFALSARCSTRACESARELPWPRLALAIILLLSAFLNLFRLTSDGYGNTYYAAAVKDMFTSWHNFFFVSFYSGFISVDKPAASGSSAAPVILKTEEPLITIGDYHGRLPDSANDKLAADLVNRGAVRFFLADNERMARAARRHNPKKNIEVMRWVLDNCERVPQEEWQLPETEEEQGGDGSGGPGSLGGPEKVQALYDCGTVDSG